MGFTNENSKALQSAASRVFSAYLALEKSRTFCLPVEGGGSPNQTFNRIIQARVETLRDGESASIRIKGREFMVTRPADPQLPISVTVASGGSASGLAQHVSNKPSEYASENAEDVDEILEVLSENTLQFSRDATGVINFDKPFVNLNLEGGTVNLGGPHKKDLYQTHLDVLRKIIIHLSDPKGSDNDLNSLLVALPTGAGKTYIQAMWFLVLYSAGISGVFTLPGNLSRQFIKDFLELLPKHLVDLITPLDVEVKSRPTTPRDNKKNIESNKDKGEEGDLQAKSDPEVQLQANAELAADAEGSIFDGLRARDQGPVYYIGSHDEVLDRHFDVFDQAENLAVIIDEQHKAIEVETRKLAVRKFAEDKLTLFLTATPDEATYRLCKEPVAVMSSIEKKKAGQGNFSRIHVIKTKDINDLRKESNSGQAILAMAVDAIEPHATSTATSLLCDIPYMIERGQIVADDHPQKNRWNAVPVLSRKALVCAGEVHDDLINISEFTHSYQSPQEQLANLYCDGNLRNRQNAYNLLLNDKNEDEGFARAYLEKNEAAYQNDFSQTFQRPASAEGLGLVQQLDNTIFHGLVEIMIRGVLAYENNGEGAIDRFKQVNSIDLNLRRRNDLEGLARDFHQKLQEMKANKGDVLEYFKSLLAYHRKMDKDDPRKENLYGIDEAGALKAAEVIVEMFHSVPSERVNDDQRVRARARLALVDNWQLDNGFKELCDRNNVFRRKFPEYASENRTLFIMSNMGEKETPIEDGRPFRRFVKDVVRLKDAKGFANEEAKKRFLAPSEYLNPEATETHFSPAYCDFNEEIADNYFKLGIVPLMVSNCKSEGFNDPNLHSVVSLIPTSGDRNNKPSQVIQQQGRNRGLDTTQIPTVIQCYGKTAAPVFDATLPERTEKYYPAYFKAEKQYIPRLIESLGVEAAQEIMSSMAEITDKEEKIDPDLFRYKVLKIIVEKLRNLNNHNDHNIKLSKRQFRQALKVVERELGGIVKKMQHPFTLPKSIGRIGSLAYAAARFVYFIKNYSASFLFSRFSREAAKDRAELRKLQKGTPEEQQTNQVAIRDLQVKVLYAKAIRAHSLVEVFGAGIVANQIEKAFKRKLKIIETKLERVPYKIISAEKIAEINTFVKADILPFLASYFAAEHRPGLMARAMAFDQWPEILFRHRDEFQRLESAQSETEKSAVLAELSRAFFSEVDGVAATLPQEDYFARVGKIQADLARMKEDHSIIYKNYAEFFQGDFLSHLQLFMPNYYFVVMSRILKDKDNAAKFSKKFCDYFIGLESEGKMVQVDEGAIFNLFRDSFEADYSELKELESLSALHDTAEVQAGSVGADVKGIFEKYGFSEEPSADAAPATPAPAENPAGFLGSFRKAAAAAISSSVKTITVGAKSMGMAAKFLYYSPQISADLAAYFRGDFLGKMTKVLPQQEFDLLSVVLKDEVNSRKFANYIVANARELMAEGGMSLDGFVKHFNECFKDDPSVRNRAQFRTQQAIEAAAEQSTLAIKNQSKAIAEDYLRLKLVDLKAKIADYFVTEGFLNNFGAMVKISTPALPSQQSSEALFKQLMRREVPPNASSFAERLVERYAGLVGGGSMDSEAQGDPLRIFSEVFLDCFRELDEIHDCQLSFLHEEATQAFQKFADSQAEMINAVDVIKLKELMAKNFSDILFHEENITIVNFYLQDFSQKELAILLAQNRGFVVEGTPEFAQLEREARQLLRLQYLLNEGMFQQVVDEFMTVPAASQFKGPPEDRLQQMMSGTRLTRVLENLGHVAKQVTDWHCQHNQTTLTGDPQRTYSRLEGIFAILGNGLSESDKVALKLTFLQAQSVSAEAADKISATANKNSINALKRAKDHLVKPFLKTVNSWDITFRFYLFRQRLKNAIGAFFAAIGYYVKKISAFIDALDGVKSQNVEYKGEPLSEREATRAEAVKAKDTELTHEIVGQLIPRKQFQSLADVEAEKTAQTNEKPEDTLEPVLQFLESKKNRPAVKVPPIASDSPLQSRKSAADPRRLEDVPGSPKSLDKD